MLSRVNRSQDRQNLLEKGLTYSHLEMTLVQDNRVFWATGFTISFSVLRPIALLSSHTLQNYQNILDKKDHRGPRHVCYDSI